MFTILVEFLFHMTDDTLVKIRAGLESDARVIALGSNPDDLLAGALYEVIRTTISVIDEALVCSGYYDAQAYMSHNGPV